MTQLMWPWHAMIKAHKVILSAHSVWINNFGECLYQSKKGILEPSGKVWYQPARNTLRDNVEKEGGASAFMMGEEQEEETKVCKRVRKRRRRRRRWRRRRRRRACRSWWGSTGDHDKQTEETLLADNADVEEEKEESLEKLMGTNLFWDQEKQNSEIWISLLISLQ